MNAVTYTTQERVQTLSTEVDKGVHKNLPVFMAELTVKYFHR